MRLFLLTCLVFSSLSTHSQDTRLDSLYRALETHPKEDSVRVKLLFQICRMEYFKDKDKMPSLAKQALEISERIGFVNGRGYAYVYFCVYYRSIGDFDKVADNALKVIETFENTTNDDGLAQGYNLLALVHQQWKDFSKAEYYHLKAIEINSKMGRMADVARDYLNLGSTLALGQQFSKAIDYFHKSLTIKQELGDEEGIANCYINLGHAYQSTRNPDLSIESFNKALPISRKSDNQVALAEIGLGLARVYLEKGSVEKAAALAEEALGFTKSVGDKARIQEAYQTLTEIEKKRNNQRQALAYLELAHVYGDSVFSEKKVQQIAELEARYENEKKEQTIELLTRDKAIQALWRNILVATLLILLISAMMAYLLQRFRERKNREYLNLRIDLLTGQNRELAEKYQRVVTGDDPRSVESADQKLFRHALEIVENNLGDPLFGVEKMADEMAMSRVSLHRRLKSITGFAPGDFIRNVRLKRAASLLRNNADTVSQIGLLVGFEDQSYFSKSFKRQFGVTPSEYSKPTPA